MVCIVAFSSLSANCFNSSDTAVLSIIFAQEIESDDPNALNSNLLPVNAKGEVLFLSVVSLGSGGNTSAPIFKNVLPLAFNGLLDSIESTKKLEQLIELFCKGKKNLCIIKFEEEDLNKMNYVRNIINNVETIIKKRHFNILAVSCATMVNWMTRKAKIPQMIPQHIRFHSRYSPGVFDFSDSFSCFSVLLTRL